MDVLVYCPDTEKLKKELKEKFQDRLDECLPPDKEKHLAFLSEDLNREKFEIETMREMAWEEARKEGTVISTFLIDKTPTVRNGDETLALVRCSNTTLEMLDALKSLQVLGSYEEVLADKKLKAIHDRVYPRKPINYKDENGKKHTYTPPERIGAFA